MIHCRALVERRSVTWLVRAGQELSLAIGRRGVEGGAASLMDGFGWWHVLVALAPGPLSPFAVGNGKWKDGGEAGMKM